jgi:peptidoglycan hydrolase-like protein with peptidoglycan-binding domain
VAITNVIANGSNTNIKINKNMAKKIIRLTEGDLMNIVKRVISEQTEQREFIRGIQNFLNTKGAKLVVDGKTGPNSQTEGAISNYQAKIGVYPADGVWGPDTWDKMPEKDKVLLKKLIAEEGGLIDEFLNWLGL